MAHHPPRPGPNPTAAGAQRGLQMTMLQQVTDWIKDHAWFAGAVTVGSIIALLATGAAAVWALGRLPTDHLTHTGRGRRFAWASPPGRIALIAGKNVIGWLLILGGLAMLALPGQGLLTMVVGLVLVDLPGKRRLERSILCREGVLRRLNGVRRRMGRPPLESCTTGRDAASTAAGPTIPHGEADR